MNRLKGLSALAGSLLAVLLMTQAAPAAAAAAPAKPKVAVAVKASPAKHTGKCPVTVGFTAKIKVSAPTVVAYRWLRGDGSKSAVKTVKVNRTKILKDRATFRGNLKGWQALQVLSPREVVSRKAAFTISCAPQGGGGNGDNGGDGGVDPQGPAEGQGPDGPGGEQGGTENGE
ncbi:hypothetical protein [Streptosporangium sp. CA-115845]|uniref:hypothetical protein n=1 Tax=Streptosporangium sp. CA-115845 TaxID=3240071 RepID=UPI003D93DBF4